MRLNYSDRIAALENIVNNAPKCSSIKDLRKAVSSNAHVLLGEILRAENADLENDSTFKKHGFTRFKRLLKQAKNQRPSA